MIFSIVNKKVEVLLIRNYLRHSTPGISENARKKKDEHFQGHITSIQFILFFRFTKIQYFINVLTWSDS